MAAEPPSMTPPPARGPAPIPPAVRQRLQKQYEHALKSSEKGEYDYATQFLTECVVEDPGNVVYLQGFLNNLQKKYGPKKKGARFAGIKSTGHRMSLSRAAGKGDWKGAFQAGCAALALNPWDADALVGLADASKTLRLDASRLRYLQLALEVDPKSADVHREMALALQDFGQFDQAISHWRKVVEAKPEDEEATQAVSRLSVEQTIQKGGYDPTLLANTARREAGKPHEGKPVSVAHLSRGGAPIPVHEPSFTPEERLLAAIEVEPTVIENYLRLGDIYMHQDRLDDAERMYERGSQASGGGDMQARERLEELLIKRASRRHDSARAHYEHEKTPEAKQLFDRARIDKNQVELEVYAARADRDKNNLRVQFELGMRLKTAGKYREAISAFQAARGEPKRKALVLIELGECFQKIEQYKLALSHYEQAVEAVDPADMETRKLALYRAGVLATGLRELDLAERRLGELAGLDFGYRDVADRLDKLPGLRDKG